MQLFFDVANCHVWLARMNTEGRITRLDNPRPRLERWIRSAAKRSGVIISLSGQYELCVPIPESIWKLIGNIPVEKGTQNIAGVGAVLPDEKGTS